MECRDFGGHGLVGSSVTAHTRRGRASWEREGGGGGREERGG